MATFAPAGLPVSGGNGFGARPRGRRLALRARSIGRPSQRGEAVDDAAVLADVDVPVVVEHQPRHHRVGLLARQPGDAHHVGQADAPLAGADGREDAAARSRVGSSGGAGGPKKKRFTLS